MTSEQINRPSRSGGDGGGINAIQDEIIEEFSGLDDWMDKYQLLIDLGNEQVPLDEQYKTESRL